MSGKRGLRCSVGGPNVACLVWAAPASQTLMGESFRRTPMPPRPLLGEASGGHSCRPDSYWGKPQEGVPASQTVDVVKFLVDQGTIGEWALEGKASLQNYQVECKVEKVKLVS